MASDILIITDRLILRPIRLQDSEFIFKYRSDAVANQFQGWIPTTISDVHEFINQKISAQIDIPDTWFQLAIVMKDNDELIGDIGIHFLKTEPSEIELGVTLNLNFQGKGYATEALTSIISYSFSELKKNRILVSIDPNNESSLRLFKRLAFRRREISAESDLTRREWPEDIVFALQHDEWL